LVKRARRDPLTRTRLYTADELTELRRLVGREERDTRVEARDDSGATSDRP